MCVAWFLMFPLCIGRLALARQVSDATYRDYDQYRRRQDGKSCGEGESLGLDDLRAAGFRGPKVAVLSPRNDAACFAATLTEQPWRDLLTPLAHSGPHGPVFDLHSAKTRYTTVHRFKGLESRAVVLTDIERLSTPRERDLFYVGATRATQRLIVLAHESLRGTLQ